MIMVICIPRTPTVEENLESAFVLIMSMNIFIATSGWHFPSLNKNWLIIKYIILLFITNKDKLLFGDNWSLIKCANSYVKPSLLFIDLYVQTELIVH